MQVLPILQVRTNGGWRFFVRLLFQGYQGGAAGVGPFRWQWGPAAGQQAGQQGAGRPGASRRRVTLEEVADALAKLPTEAYMTPQQMAALSVHELKVGWCARPARDTHVLGALVLRARA